MLVLYYALALCVLVALGVFVVRTLALSWAGVDVTAGSGYRPDGSGFGLWHVIVVPLNVGFFGAAVGGVLLTLPVPGDESRVLMDVLPHRVQGVLLLFPFVFLVLVLPFMAVFRRPKFLIPPRARTLTTPE